MTTSMDSMVKLAGGQRQRKPPAQAAAAAPRVMTSLASLMRRAPALPRATRAGFEAQQRRLGLGTAEASESAAGIEPERWQAALNGCREQLHRHGLSDTTIGPALALAALAMSRELRRVPYPTQLYAAWLMLRGRLAEMATGEGKTLAAALASAVGALSGVSVHVLTANDYLVERDREMLAPFYAALGLSSAVVLPSRDRSQRAAAYRCNIVHVTARELVFDYLNDHLRLAGERDPQMLRARSLAAADEDQAGAVCGSADRGEPVLARLSFAVIDEADSILLDEACVPLILSRPGPALDRDCLKRAFGLARDLVAERDYRLDAQRRQAELTDAGRLRIGAEVKGAVGLLRPARRAFELVESALMALHQFRRDREYAVLGGELLLIDEVTGRVAEGRRWSGALHAMVEIKEGLEPQMPAVTAAQMTYQRFFDRYEHLCGMSGTLQEARRELSQTYGLKLARVPLAQPDRRRWFGERLLPGAEAKWRAVVDRVSDCRRRGRPVLIGTESVTASLQLSAHLSQAGIEHQVLNAVQSRDEAELIARAGRVAAVTVATNIAGRGTDIQLDSAARRAGGLHVIATMRNRSRRIDRQLIGRGARHGDPGSAESILSLDDSLIANRWSERARCWIRRLRRDDGATTNKDVGLGAPAIPRWLASVVVNAAQRRAEWYDRLRRQRLRQIEDRQAEMFGWFGGTE